MLFRARFLHSDTGCVQRLFLTKKPPIKSFSFSFTRDKFHFFGFSSLPLILQRCPKGCLRNCDLAVPYLGCALPGSDYQVSYLSRTRVARGPDLSYFLQKFRQVHINLLFFRKLQPENGKVLIFLVKLLNQWWFFGKFIRAFQWLFSRNFLEQFYKYSKII